MTTLHATLLTLTLIATPFVAHVGSARAQSTLTIDPKTTYGWVFLETGRTTKTNVSVPANALGTFEDSKLPRRVNGYDLSSVVKLKKIESDPSITVNLARASLVFRGGENRRIRNDSRPRYDVFLELEFTISSGAKTVPNKQLPVRITLENAQNGSETSFFVVAQMR
jgi:hypothetical protein